MAGNGKRQSARSWSIARRRYIPNSRFGRSFPMTDSPLSVVDSMQIVLSDFPRLKKLQQDFHATGNRGVSRRPSAGLAPVDTHEARESGLRASYALQGLFELGGCHGSAVLP